MSHGVVSHGVPFGLPTFSVVTNSGELGWPDKHHGGLPRISWQSALFEQDLRSCSVREAIH